MGAGRSAFQLDVDYGSCSIIRNFPVSISCPTRAGWARSGSADTANPQLVGRRGFMDVDVHIPAHLDGLNGRSLRDNPANFQHVGQYAGGRNLLSGSGTLNNQGIAAVAVGLNLNQIVGAG